MLRTERLITVIMAFVFAAALTFVSYAGSDDLLSIYNSHIVTGDTDSVFIEGMITNGHGGKISVRHGLKTVAVKVIPDTGSTQNFRIKLPQDSINTDRGTTFFVKYKDNEEGKHTAKVVTEYIAKQEQTISTGKDDYTLTIPGFSKSLKADSTSGGDLIYTSSDDSVAKVDSKGRIEGVGKGKAYITVRQIGDSRYEGAEKKVAVKVDEIDAYKVVFHSEEESEDGSVKEEESEQVIKTGDARPLDSNTFTNGDHTFLGWATEEDGDVVYTDGETVADLGKKGEDVDLYAVWTGNGAKAALAWAINIANDDSFAYGTGPACHRIGCYFCGTNQKNKPKGYEKTYVCLTFVGAAYAHGAEDPEILAADQGNKMPMYENDDNFSQFSCWYKVGSCASLTIDDLRPGDVIIKWAANNDTGHVCMYAGGDNIVEASVEGWGARTIAVNSGAARRLRSLASDSRNYVMRYRY